MINLVRFRPDHRHQIAKEKEKIIIIGDVSSGGWLHYSVDLKKKEIKKHKNCQSGEWWWVVALQRDFIKKIKKIKNSFKNEN